MTKRGPRKTYSEEFKREAVRMCQSRSVCEVAEALGVNNTTLYQWEKQLEAEKRDREERAALGGGLTRKELEEENKRLKRENENLKEEAEILKKASAYFAKYLR